MEHLLKLSDEYQVKLVFDLCVKFLEKQSIGESNVMKILMLANLYKLESVRQKCYNLLKNMKLQAILTFAEQQDLDKENLQNILTQRVERLENFLKELHPQFIGMVECCFWLWHEAKKYMQWCPRHFSDGKSNTDIDKRLQECTVCKEMITRMINGTETQNYYYCSFDHTYGGSLHFDNLLPTVIEEFSELLKRQ